MSITLGQLGARLPGGYFDASGGLHREVELAPLTGREEEIIVSGAGPQAVTGLLSRCVRRIGSVSPVPPEVARALLVADRQFLLLRIREMAFGSKVQARVGCPWRDCGENADIDFSISDLPVREQIDPRPWFECELSPEAALENADGARHASVVFRLPQGIDQEQLSPLLRQSEPRALRRLLGNCLRRLGPYESPGGETVDALSPLACMEIERMMEERAPAVDMEIATACHACGRVFRIPLDLQEFFFGEFRGSRDFLYREVHYLAYHYHWGEAEILDLPRDKRLRYINLLAEEIDRLNHAQG